jgi:Endomembrane protein 70
MDRRVDITDTDNPQIVQFSYSVEWYPEQLEWKDRLSRYTENRFVPSSFEIHWLSIINSFVLVLLLTAFLTIIMLRVLKNDFSRYMELDDEALEEEEVRPISFVQILILEFGTHFWPPNVFENSLVGNLFTAMCFAFQKIQGCFVPPLVRAIIWFSQRSATCRSP